MSKEDIDFHLVIAHAFYDNPRKNNDQLTSLLGAIMKNTLVYILKINFKLKNIHRIMGYNVKINQRNQCNYEYTTNSKGHQLQQGCMCSIE